MVVGDGKSGGEEMRGGSSFPEATGMKTSTRHPVVHGGALGVVGV